MDLENPHHRVVGFLSTRTGRVPPFAMQRGEDERITVRGHHVLALDDGNAYIVMEMLDGESLDRRLADHGALPVPQALRLTRRPCSSIKDNSQIAVRPGSSQSN